MRDRHLLRSQTSHREVQLTREEVVNFFLSELRFHKGLLEADQTTAGQLQPLLPGLAGLQEVIHFKVGRSACLQAGREGRVRRAQRVTEAVPDLEIEEDTAKLIGAAHTV